MHIIKEIKSVQGNQVIIDLPKNFAAQCIEVIVILMPLNTDRESWQQDFNSISQWDITEEQVKMTSWQIAEF